LQCLYCITVFGLPVSVRDIAPGKPHSAFMERVETKLTKVWEEERANVNTAPVVTVHRTS